MRVRLPVAGISPHATIAIDRPMVPWPHMCEYWVASIQIMPASASGDDGGVRNTPYMSRWPRGSCISALRNQS